jgi:hypothetical protein
MGYKFLNPEQEAMLPLPKSLEDAQLQLRGSIKSIIGWSEAASQGGRNACIMVGFYLGRITTLYRSYPELANESVIEVAGLNKILNDIVDNKL